MDERLHLFSRRHHENHYRNACRLFALGSASVFAEGGAERMRYYYDNFPLQHAQSEQKSDANAKEIRVPADQTAQVTEAYRD